MNPFLCLGDTLRLLARIRKDTYGPVPHRLEPRSRDQPYEAHRPSKEGGMFFHVGGTLSPVFVLTP
jgi:hypothetical protein